MVPPEFGVEDAPTNWIHITPFFRSHFTLRRMVHPNISDLEEGNNA